MYYEYTSTTKQVLLSVIKIVLTILLVANFLYFNYNRSTNDNDNVRLLMALESGVKIFHTSRKK